MKMMWCWRCSMEVPMMDETEFLRAEELYRKIFSSRDLKGTELVTYHYELTGVYIGVPNAIIHHRIASYGPPCELCGKPYRTPQARFCAACWHERNADADN